MSASPVNPEGSGRSSPRLVPRGGGIWQLGLLAGAAAGAATVGAAAVRGGSSQTPARSLRREGFRDGGPRRAKHGSRRGPDAAGPRLSGSGTKLWSPLPWPHRPSLIPTCSWAWSLPHTMSGLICTSFSTWTLSSLLTVPRPYFLLFQCRSLACILPPACPHCSLFLDLLRLSPCVCV